MAIGNLSEQDFVEILKRELHPSQPIRSFEHLYGRERQLESIKQALYTPGRQIFIFGDRGVGKTSLAQTAAIQHQSSDKEPIFVSCERRSTFGEVLANILRKMLPVPTQSSQSVVHGGEMSLPGVGKYSGQVKTELQAIGDTSNINNAITLLKYHGASHSKRPMVVIDEFDLLDSPEERQRFADFIKQVGDQEVPVQFIFCGIGTSLDELLNAHTSCYRYLESIELQRLIWSPREEIITRSAEALGIEVDDHSKFRITAISDGFPHYVHLVCLKLYWEMFNDPSQLETSTPDRYAQAINEAVRGIEPHLRRSYDKATMKDRDEYQEILWAVADHSDLTRNTKDIYRSYERIMDVRNKEPMSWRRFIAKLNVLKNENYGSVLKSERRSWYGFSENIVRGYVRLRAEDLGCPLALEHGGPRPLTKIPTLLRG